MNNSTRRRTDKQVRTYLGRLEHIARTGQMKPLSQRRSEAFEAARRQLGGNQSIPNRKGRRA